jgi:hypothetical protein
MHVPQGRRKRHGAQRAAPIESANTDLRNAAKLDARQSFAVSERAIAN